jgi:hypothetical protein
MRMAETSKKETAVYLRKGRGHPVLDRVGALHGIIYPRLYSFILWSVKGSFLMYLGSTYFLMASLDGNQRAALGTENVDRDRLNHYQ